MTIDDWNPGTGPIEGTFSEERDPALTEIERQAQDAARPPDDDQAEPSDT